MVTGHEVGNGEVDSSSAQRELTPIRRPRAKVAPLVTSSEEFLASIKELKTGVGPLAVDAERASGYRYNSHAYLFQFFRHGSRIFLVDPIGLRGESAIIEEFNDAFRDELWLIHASTQDLPCIREFGLRPHRLFDTELGARLAGFPRVGLGPLAEELLGLSLAKEHSAVDWSIRPLHPEWRAYAALDVDVLIDLYEGVSKALNSQGKASIAEEEFESILKAPPPAPRKDPWRRTSGMHKVKGRRALALVRELWLTRDALAREIDIAPGRLFPDLAIADLALAASQMSAEQFKSAGSEMIRTLPSARRKGMEQLGKWTEAILRALAIEERDLPPMRSATDSLPPVKVWREKAPLAYARLTHARFHLQARAHELGIPLENLISPESVRRLIWSSERREFDSESAKEFLSELGVRHWQVNLASDIIVRALQESEPLLVNPITVDGESADSQSEEEREA